MKRKVYKKIIDALIRFQCSVDSTGTEMDSYACVFAPCDRSAMNTDLTFS
jgi:hypothetical protein